ncbi:MAG: SpoIID/LytB domain-containing protein [Candidatus Omnitrophica bacterium]|nr:SpoIID/LytB domain-containing protein [Candidatus Omnitrophota bacterium]
MKKRILKMIVLLLLALSLSASGQAEDVKDFNRGKDMIRIAVIKDAQSVTLRIRGHYDIVDPRDGEVIESRRRMKRTKIVPSTHGIQVGSFEFVQDRLRFIPKRDVSLMVQDKERRYRGFIDIVRTKDDKLLAINIVNVEDYIRGVLYHEVSHRWPMEALKVQAVAARTYALYRMKTHSKSPYDVTNDIYSQVYGGRISEKYRTNIAVARTEGEVMLFNGEILPAYYHATCGGHSENAAELWNHESMLPLRGVTCRFCMESPHYNWKKNIRLKDIQEKLNANGYNLGLIKEIRVIDRNPSERIKTLELVTRDGKKATVSGKDFRQIIGPNVIKSNNYYVVMKGYYCDFIGKGWGHGVGMCQWGAQGMARQRFEYKDILEFYYPGIHITDFMSVKIF